MATDESSIGIREEHWREGHTRQPEEGSVSPHSKSGEQGEGE